MFTTFTKFVAYLLSDLICTSRDNARVLRPVLRGAGGANPPLPTRLGSSNGIPRCMLQIMRIMRLTTFLLILSVMHVAANGLAQNLTLTSKRITLGQIFKEVSKQTGYNVFWERNLLNENIAIKVDFKATPLERVIEQCLAGKDLVFTIQDKTVVISKKEYSTLERILKYFNIAEIKGKVTDQTGMPLVGATIKVKGTGKTVLSNSRGEFLLKDVGENAVLTISYIGYQPKEMKVSGTAFLNISLIPAPLDLEQVTVVFTGYQTLKKSQLTGAYSSIDRDEYMQSVPVAGNLTDNLEGKLSGLILNVNQSRNSWQDAGNTSPFAIRGVSTFQAIKKPLIVLNGFPTEVDIESINPYDIESVTILKDAAAAAIYGVRASNGVVVINTRKGFEGRPKFEFTTALTYKGKPDYNKLKLLKGRDYVNFERDAALNNMKNNGLSKDLLDMVNGTYTPVFGITDDLFNNKISQSQADEQFDRLAAYDNTDDYKRLFLQNQLLQTYDFNVSGGGTNATYYFGLNRQDNPGIAKNSGYKNTTVNYRGSFDFSNRVNLDVQTIYSTSTVKQSTIPEYTQFKPYQRFMDEDGKPVSSYFGPFVEAFFGFGESYGTISSALNQANIASGLYDQMYAPYQEMFESTREIKTNSYRVQGNLGIKLLAGLKLELGGVYEREDQTTTNLASEHAYQTRIMLNYFASKDPVSGRPIFNIPQGGVKKSIDNDISAYTLRAQLAYNHLLAGKHDLAFLGGVEQRRNSNSSRLNTVFGYNSNTLTVKPANLGLLGNGNYFPDFLSQIVSGYGGFAVDQTRFEDFFNERYNDDRFFSYYANGAYTYDEKYSITGSLRIDQSNLFGTDPKFRYTPLWSTGLSWNLHNEDFLKASGFVTNLKLRVAGGYNGNIKKGSGPFNLLRAAINNYVPSPLIGYEIEAPRNNSLRWEKTFNFNAGLDFGLLSGRISGTVDYYIKRGNDIFSDIESDPTRGFSNLLTNNASIENRGVDLSLSSVNIQEGNFTWSSQLTGSFNKSKVLKLRNTFRGLFNFTRAGGAESIEGHPMNSVLTLDYAGLNADGQPMVRDENGNLVVLRFGPQVDVPLSALKFSGVNDPKYVLGLTNQFRLGSFSLSALIMYYGGHVALVRPPSIYGNRPLNGIQNYWKKPGDEAHTNIPGFDGAFGTPQYIDTRHGYENASQFVRKLDFLSLRNVTLTYHMKNDFSRKIGLDNTRLIFQVQNPAKYVFSGNDIDPETFDFVQGRRGLPIVPAFTFSLSTNF